MKKTLTIPSLAPNPFRFAGDSQRLHVHPQSGNNEGRVEGLLVCPDIGKPVVVQGETASSFSISPGRLSSFRQSMELGSVTTMGGPAETFLILIRFPGRGGKGEEIHATVGRTEDQRYRSGLHESQEHLCSIQSRSEVGALVRFHPLKSLHSVAQLLMSIAARWLGTEASRVLGC